MPLDIYHRLAEHQAADDWKHRELMQELQTWVGRFNEAFQLKVPQVSLRIDWLRATRLGHFRCGHNGFGLQREIALNERYLHTRAMWQLLGTLFHELLHGWQESYGRAGRRNYHNREFRRKAADYGLVVDQRGYTQYWPDSPFFALLEQHGVPFPVQPQPLLTQPTRGRGKSTLKKWRCGCTNVRVGVAEFQARCLRCGQLFEQAE